MEKLQELLSNGVKSSCINAANEALSGAKSYRKLSVL